MKKGIALILVCLLLLAGCGQKAPEAVDLQALYSTLTASMPELLTLDADMQLNYLGIRSEDCVTAITGVCADSMRVDELWLVEAKDVKTLEMLKGMAQVRLESQAEVCESYAPDQYAVVKEGQILTFGNYLVLLISPDAAALAETVKNQFK